MSVDLYDAWTPSNIPAGARARMLYLDGGGAASADDIAAAEAAGVLILNSVLGSPAAQVLDYEAGNAGIEDVSTACAIRLGRGLWTTVYCAEDGIEDVVSGLRNKGIALTPASSWPAPGVYLHAADPTGESHLQVAWAAVQPVAVQYLWTAGYDVSATYGDYPGVPGEEDDMSFTDNDRSMLTQLFNQAPNEVAQLQSVWEWTAGYQPALQAFLAGEGPAVGAIAAAVVAALPPAAQGGLTAAEVTAAVRAAFTAGPAVTPVQLAPGPAA